MEAIVAAINAELPRAAWAEGAASAFTEASAWIWATVQQWSTRQGELDPEWVDTNGQEHTVKIQQAVASLTGWGERLDGAQMPATLTEVAGAIRATHATITANIYPRYLAAISNPLTWGIAAECVAEATAALTALTATQTRAMFQFASSVGQLPNDLVAGATDAATNAVADAATAVKVVAAAEGNSPEDFIAVADAGVDLVDAGLGVVQKGVDLVGGLSLAGAPSAALPDAASGLSLGALSPTANPVVPGGLGGFGGLGWAGAAGGNGLMSVANPVVGRWAPVLAAEARPGVLTPAAVKPTGGSLPPVVPPMVGQHAAGTLRPGSGPGHHGAVRSVTGRRAAAAGDGVPAKLRGRSGNDEDR
ncbi:hypothetical protein KZZ52_18685 [Dactylosporangium sp. AC04546]|uniref:hypothetical protein n=1 Tax=Dactylosporangium sp. AC04546 TaxID=2862460 RepID=UPI002E7B5522|nr:hypothetical protein [Dactylosporangium sp. AC04546]WVK87330.1 hypothetical protein KZZ52_18685 [Dactylosporangium sp. AC04546]